MQRHKALGLTVILAVTAVGAASCSSSSAPTSTNTTEYYNAALTGVVNPSNQTGGTLIYDLENSPDSTDPGNTYFDDMWDFTRLYGQSLMTYKSCPGACGLQLVPRLATAPGVVSDNGLTWTYHIRPNLKFSNGQPITSQDVKYAVERTFARSVLPNGPTYFQELLAPQNATCAKSMAAGGATGCYPGPYTDRSANIMGLNAVTTPNPTTIVFHLWHPFSDFNYVVAIPQTDPVPPNADTGSNYQLNVISSGPYMFKSYALNKQLILVRNPYWNAAQDPNAKQLVNEIVVNFNINDDDVSNRLIAGDIDVDMSGNGLEAAARDRVLTSPSLKKYADNPDHGVLWFQYINQKVAPLNNLHCREAVEYAADKTTLQTGWGGPVAGGAIASTILLPGMGGYTKFDLYDALSMPSGNLAAAKQQLMLCGQPNGFSTNFAYNSGPPQQLASAEALQAALARVGITLHLVGYPVATFYSDFAGDPAYANSHDIGVAQGGQGFDWPDGYGMMWTFLDGQSITPAGTSNIEQLNDPTINALFAESTTINDPAKRNAIFNEIDYLTMKDAVILPNIYGTTLLYRNPALTNVMVSPVYGMYNYLVLGLK
jgi:peptide/nickel transport system substrate-binding protein